MGINLLLLAYFHVSTNSTRYNGDLMPLSSCEKSEVEIGRSYDSSLLEEAIDFYIENCVFIRYGINEENGGIMYLRLPDNVASLKDILFICCYSQNGAGAIASFMRDSSFFRICFYNCSSLSQPDCFFSSDILINISLVSICRCPSFYNGCTA